MGSPRPPRALSSSFFFSFLSPILLLSAHALALTVCGPPTASKARFSPVALRSSLDWIQLAEITYWSGGQPVARGTASITNPGGNNPPVESPPNANDGNTATKWLDFNGPYLEHAPGIVAPGIFNPIIYDFQTSRLLEQVSITTANDAIERDPVRWRVHVSDDGLNWSLVHDQSQTDYATPTVRFAESARFDLQTCTTTYTCGELGACPSGSEMTDAQQTCAGAPCTAADCCVARCGLYTCAGLGFSVVDGQTVCPAPPGACSDLLCCAPRCGAEWTCVAPLTMIDAQRLCSPTGCTAQQCCEDTSVPTPGSGPTGSGSAGGGSDDSGLAAALAVVAVVFVCVVGVALAQRGSSASADGDDAYEAPAARKGSVVGSVVRSLSKKIGVSGGGLDVSKYNEQRRKSLALYNEQHDETGGGHSRRFSDSEDRRVDAELEAEQERANEMAEAYQQQWQQQQGSMSSAMGLTGLGMMGDATGRVTFDPSSGQARMQPGAMRVDPAAARQFAMHNNGAGAGGHYYQQQHQQLGGGHHQQGTMHMHSQSRGQQQQQHRRSQSQMTNDSLDGSTDESDDC